MERKCRCNHKDDRKGIEFYFDERDILRHKAAEEYTFRLPSGQVIPIPDYHKTLEDQKPEILTHFSDDATDDIFEPIRVESYNDYEDGLPCVHVCNEIYTCDVFTGQWRHHEEPFGSILSYALRQDNTRLLKRLEVVERENAKLKSWHEHIASRASFVDEFMSIANEIAAANEATSTDK